jgi:hypothetical protein
LIGLQAKSAQEKTAFAVDQKSFNKRRVERFGQKENYFDNSAFPFEKVRFCLSF